MNDDPRGRQELNLVAAANRGLAQAWARGLLTEPSLDPTSLIAIAERRERASIDPGDWEDALTVLADDLREAGALNPLGRSMAHGQLVGILRQRIRARRLWAEHPDIAKRRLDAPLVILGQMRSGTTLMHRLLACDPRFSFTRLHETLNPLAPAVTGRWQAAALTALLCRLNPQLRSAHPTSAMDAEEEFGLHAFSLHGAMFEAQWHVPNFARWSEARDLTPVYREFAALLRTLRWRRGDADDRIQLLKAPQFMQDLPALLEEFPDARVVLLLRYPAEVMASSASLVWNQRRIQSDACDPTAIGAEWRRKTLRRAEAAEAALRNVPAPRIVSVEFESLKADWADEIARIYGHFGFRLEPPVQERMTRVANRSGHRGHLYSPSQFGLGR